MLAILRDLKNEKLIAEVDYQFAQMIDRKQQAYNYSALQQNLALFLAALLSFHVRKGHTALRLSSSFANNPFDLFQYKGERNFLAEISQKIEEIKPLAWQSALQGHIAFSVDPKHIAPMLFQHDLLYFYRYWQAEYNVASYLQQAVKFTQDFTHSEEAIELDKKLLTRLFPDDDPNEINWQKVAVATALRKQFCVISGGPGTGKTTTVAKLLIALQEKKLRADNTELKIALVAPTGKAAARLKESIGNSLKNLKASGFNLAIPTEASTIHRLLGIQPQRDMPVHHAKNPLHVDLLVVDEASMIDLFIMEKLMDALKPTTRLIILGDKDQLASVEAGAIMGELGEFITQGYSQEHCDYLQQVTGYQLSAAKDLLAICDSLCHLQKSYRFNEHSGIGQLAKKVNSGKAVESWQLLANSEYADLVLNEYPKANSASDQYQWNQNCVTRVVSKAVELYRDYLELVKQRQKDPQFASVSDIFEAFQKVRFLSALRVGELGGERLNQMIAEKLKQEKLIDFMNSRDRYIGKPLLVTKNLPQHKIYSGDIGIILPGDEENEGVRVYFETKVDGKHLSLSLNRMPDAEVAYVMTVHKSQGSEFEHTLLIMPSTISPVVTKELAYTAITRAKEKFTLFSSEKVWKKGVEERVERQSGLKVQLESGICK